MRVGLMTREYPPYVYGGAGVHVEYLSRELAKTIEVDVYAWGETPDADSLSDPQAAAESEPARALRAAVAADLATARRPSSRAHSRRCR